MGLPRIGGPKLGRVTTPGGGAGANAHQTCDGTKRTLGPLPTGRYSIESTVDAWVVQTGAAGVVDAALDVAAIRAQGCHVPASTEVTFQADGDGYLAWAKDAAAADGTIWVNNRDDAFPDLTP